MTEPATCVELHTVVCIEVQRESTHEEKSASVCERAFECVCMFICVHLRLNKAGYTA